MPGRGALAEKLAGECAAEAEAQGDVEARLMAWCASSCAGIIMGDNARAGEMARKVIEQEERSLFCFPVLLAYTSYGMSRTMAGSFEDGIAALERLRALCDQHGERWQRAYGDVLRAQAELACGRPERARAYAMAALEVKWRLHDSLGMAMAIDVLAPAAVAAGGERAARMLGLADQIWDTVGKHQIGTPELVAARRACESEVRGVLGDRAYDSAFSAGRDTDLDAGVAYALGTSPAR
ncbi:hypothetical protein ACFQ0B_72155 [Nonomuraea thailandensis]